MRMLGSDDALGEEPVAEIEDDCSDVDEDLRCDPKADVCWVARPCYSHGHCYQSYFAEP